MEKTKLPFFLTLTLASTFTLSKHNCKLSLLRFHYRFHCRTCSLLPDCVLHIAASRDILIASPSCDS